VEVDRWTSLLTLFGLRARSFHFGDGFESRCLWVGQFSGASFPMSSDSPFRPRSESGGFSAAPRHLCCRIQMGHNISALCGRFTMPATVCSYFATAFGIASLLARRPMIEMLAWTLHILIDIPTHQGIFALHFLWPLSSYGLSGIRWENHWFAAANYTALLLLYSWIWIEGRRRPSQEP
jgi:hypothetical protein